MATRTLPEVEVEIMQFLSNGKTKQVYAIVGEDYVPKARGMMFSAEITKIGVVLCGRWQNSGKEIHEISINSPGIEGPQLALRRIIDKLIERRKVC